MSREAEYGYTKQHGNGRQGRYIQAGKPRNRGETNETGKGAGAGGAGEATGAESLRPSGQGDKGTRRRYEKTGRRGSRLCAVHAETRGGRRREERGVGATRSKRLKSSVLHCRTVSYENNGVVGPWDPLSRCPRPRGSTAGRSPTKAVLLPPRQPLAALKWAQERRGERGRARSLHPARKRGTTPQALYAGAYHIRCRKGVSRAHNCDTHTPKIEGPTMASLASQGPCKCGLQARGRESSLDPLHIRPAAFLIPLIRLKFP